MIETIDAPEAPTTDITTNLLPAERATLVLNSSKTEADLKQLAASLQDIKTVNSPAGRDQAHALAMSAVKARTTIQKAGKLAREDATAFSKAVIAEEDRLIGIIEPEENRVKDLRDGWDKAEKDRKEAEAKKERDRVASHLAVIEQIKGYPVLAREARTADMVNSLIEKLYAVQISGLEEFKETAEAARIQSGENMRTIRDAKATQEAEAAKIKVEQEEAARVLAEQQAELIAQEARMKAQQEELNRQRQEIERMKAEAKAEAEAARLAAMPKPEPEPVKKLAADPVEAIVQVMADMPQPVEPVIVTVPDTIDQMPEKPPSAINLANTIAFEYGVETATAIRWLAERADEFKTMNTIKEVTP